MTCDMDCFNCEYPDCFQNCMPTKEETKMLEAAREINEDIRKAMEYYARNKDIIIAKKKAKRKKDGNSRKNDGMVK